MSDAAQQMGVQILVLQRRRPCSTCSNIYACCTLMPKCTLADGVRDGGDAAPRGKRAGQRRQRRQHVRQPLRPGATLRRGPYGQVRPLLGKCICLHPALLPEISVYHHLWHRAGVGP